MVSSEDLHVPQQKNFKRLVRARMAKTGESYTTARSRFVPPPAATPRPLVDPDAGALARALAEVTNPLTGEPYSPELLFGLGGGIGFGYFVFAYTGLTTFSVDGRFNALYFDKKGSVEAACARLGIPVRIQQLSTVESAEKRVRQVLDAAPEALLTVDLTRVPGQDTPDDWPYLPYPVTVSAQGPDLAVTGLPGGTRTMAWPELLDARWMHAKKYGGLYVFGPPGGVDVRSAVLAAVERTAGCLLEPGRGTFDSNVGVPGMRKWARLLTDPRDPKGWPKLCADPESLGRALAAVVWGLGRADPSATAHRRLYAAFLDQAAALVEKPALAEVATAYRELGARWAELVGLAEQPGATGADLAVHLSELADAEESTATVLRAAVREGAAR
ncbi:hypothetical protein Pme01_04600 [Planosporangium mesophilum]|uniref:DUF4872 domain-containing protein n=1 Tax=Planosporangium mesophilum TaxID=689768 RepID=A0A8J3T5Z7_9ACTN|nr:hypothetical protein Pme01_04600 [Planosporangium mesophilum]